MAEGAEKLEVGEELLPVVKSHPAGGIVAMVRVAHGDNAVNLKVLNRTTAATTTAQACN